MTSADMDKIPAVLDAKNAVLDEVGILLGHAMYSTNTSGCSQKIRTLLSNVGYKFIKLMEIQGEEYDKIRENLK